ncbi:hypothetical protein [Longitalea arenae]|uniref:hypothetical protein n=1 Tax=Longitalea arenae TaxID=2812558 RepID=UPI00196893DD|nr:hypothetical protein [Longitalea arenae]
MKRTSLGSACLALLFCLAQMTAVYANKNGGAAAPAPAPTKNGWHVNLQSLQTFNQLVSILEKIQYWPTRATNSTITNNRPLNKELDMAWLEVEYTDNTPTQYIMAYDNRIVTPNGSTAAFTCPDLTGNIYRISLRHLGSSFPCEETATLKANNSETTYLGWSSCVERIEWLNFPLPASLTGGVVIVVN